MVKKVIKKKSVAVKPAPPPEDVDLPMANQNDVDDVAEDYQVVDMSNIEAPVIEFVMPNLGEMKIEKSEDSGAEKEEKSDSDVEKPKKFVKKPIKSLKKGPSVSESKNSDTGDKKPKKLVKKSPKGAKKAASEVSNDDSKDSDDEKALEVSDDDPKDSDVEKIQLTAEKLNNELVKLRPFIVKSKNQLMSKLVRQKKELEEKLKKNKGGVKEEVERKIQRLLDEILGLKTIDKDTIAKFAALNTKTLNQLKINGKTVVAERLMYKLACQEVVTQKMDSVREKYIEWNKTAAFFMQRLGQQYSNKPEKKEKKVVVETTKEDSDDVVEDSEGDDDDVDEEGDDDEEIPDDYDQSDVEIGDSDEDVVGDEAAKKRRSLLLGLIGVKEDASRPALKPKKRKLVEEDDDDVVATSSETLQKRQKTKEAVKQEMKQILEKELKTKEIEKPKQKKGKKTLKSARKVAKKVEPEPEPKQESDEPEDVEEDSNQIETLVMKVDLSKGGKIAKTPKTAPAKAKDSEEKKSNYLEDSEDDDDDESAAFFLPKSSLTAPTGKRSAKVKAMEKMEDGSKPKSEKKKKNEKKKPTPSTTITSTDKKKGSSKTSTALTGEMHPSWIASQLKKKEAAAAKPCGKKIVFSDEDD